MTKSENIAELTADDIIKLKKERISRGCFWILAIPLLLAYLWCLFMFRWKLFGMSEVIFIAVMLGIPTLIVFAVHKFVKNKNLLIENDIIGGKKKIIVAPITEKRIESSDITRGRDKGGISMEYFMKVADGEYPMTEHKYLKIPVGEWMEIHLTPHSKTVVRERWLKQEGKKEAEINYQ